MKILLVITLMAVAGCGSTAREDYYKAIAEANRAEAAAYQAKADALKAVAQADPSVAGAVAMALALSSTRTVAPAYIESEGLSYTKALAGPVAAIGGAFIAADVAKASVRSNERVQIASSEASSQTLVGIAETISAGNTAANQALVSVATSPSAPVVDAEFANAALQTVESVAIGSQESLTEVAYTGLETTRVVAQDGMNMIHNTASDGLQTVETIALDNNATILELSNNLQPVITPTEITPIVIQPVVTP